MLSYRLVLYCDICIVSLKYFFTYGTLNLTFFTLHYITMQSTWHRQFDSNELLVCAAGAVLWIRRCPWLHQRYVEWQRWKPAWSRSSVILLWAIRNEFRHHAVLSVQWNGPLGLLSWGLVIQYTLTLLYDWCLRCRPLCRFVQFLGANVHIFIRVIYYMHNIIPEAKTLLNCVVSAPALSIFRRRFKTLSDCTFGTTVVLEVILVTYTTLKITELNWTAMSASGDKLFCAVYMEALSLRAPDVYRKAFCFAFALELLMTADTYRWDGPAATRQMYPSGWVLGLAPKIHLDVLWLFVNPSPNFYTGQKCDIWPRFLTQSPTKRSGAAYRRQCFFVGNDDKELISRLDSERELFLWWHRTKYNRLAHKFRDNVNRKPMCQASKQGYKESNGKAKLKR